MIRRFLLPIVAVAVLVGLSVRGWSVPIGTHTGSNPSVDSVIFNVYSFATLPTTVSWPFLGTAGAAGTTITCNDCAVGRPTSALGYTLADVRYCHWTGAQWNCDGSSISQNILDYGASCVSNSIVCTGDGSTTVTCGGGTGNFGVGQGVYIARGSTDACSVNGGACNAPTAPTVGVGMSSRLQSCTDVTVTANDGAGHGQYVSAGLCDFSYLQAGDTITISSPSTGGSHVAGDVGWFTVFSATATTLLLTTTVTGEAAGAPFNFQTTVPIGGGAIAIGNCNHSFGAFLDPQQRGFNEFDAGTALAYGSYKEVDGAGVCTLTFHSTDAGKKVTVYYSTVTPPAGATQYCLGDSYVDGIRGGHSTGASACVTTKTLTFPDFRYGMPFLFAEPAAVTGAYAHDIYLSLDGGVTWLPKSRVWPNQTHLAGAVTLPQATISVGGTYGFPPTNTLDIEGEAVTCTGQNMTQFTGCAGGSAAHAAGALVVSTAAPKLNMSLGGGIIYGQDTWVGENIPLTLPAAPVPRDVSDTAPPIITAKGATTLTLSAPVPAGSVQVTHSDQNALAAALANVPNFGETLHWPNSCVTRFCQMPFDRALSNADIITFEGEGGQTSTSELQSYCDGGGPEQQGSNVIWPTGGAIADPGNLILRNVAVTSTHSGLGQLINMANSFFGVLAGENVKLFGTSSTNGNNHTAGIFLRLVSGYMHNLVANRMEEPLIFGNSANGYVLDSGGSINTALAGKLFHPFISYRGSNSDIVIDGAVFEDPWTLMRPGDGNGPNAMTAIVWLANYTGDVGNWSANAPARGAVVDYEGSSGLIGGATFGTNFPGIGGIYVGNGATGQLTIHSSTTNGGLFGVLAENGTSVNIDGSNFGGINNYNAAVELRGNASASNNKVTGLGGDVGQIGYRAGYAADGSTCNTGSTTRVSFRGGDNTTVAQGAKVCPTVKSAIVDSDMGQMLIQGAKPTVGTCGATPVQPAGVSTNLDFTFTAGTSGPALLACTVTFATGVQGTMTGTPKCHCWDETDGTVWIKDAPTAAPTATDVLTFSADADSHVISCFCSWHN